MTPPQTMQNNIIIMITFASDGNSKYVNIQSGSLNAKNFYQPLTSV